MARVITRRWLRTNFTTSLFCRGVALQQTTAWQQAVSSRNCLCRLSCRANSRVFPVITSPARSPESRGAEGWCKSSLKGACSGETGFFFWSSFKIVPISTSQASLKQEAKTVSLGLFGGHIEGNLSLPFFSNCYTMATLGTFKDLTALPQRLLCVCGKQLKGWGQFMSNSTAKK